MTMEAISTALGTLKTAADLLAGFNKLKNETELLQTKTELLQLIYQANNDIMALQIEHFALLSRCAYLENQLLDKDGFAVEKQHYRLHRLESGCLVYRFQPPPDSNIPEHDLCAHCYQQNIKSILQFGGYNGNFHKYSCPYCGTDILGNRLPPGTLASSFSSNPEMDW